MPTHHNRPRAAARLLLGAGMEPGQVAVLTGDAPDRVEAQAREMARDCLAGTGRNDRRPVAPVIRRGYLASPEGRAQAARLREEHDRIVAHARRCKALPPVTADEAARLQAEWLAKGHTPTVGPTVRLVAEINDRGPL